jgi:hypothetical protein
MGTFANIQETLGKEFSFRQYCKACNLNENQWKEARNQLNMMAKRGYVKRINRNVYQKLKA